MTEIVIKSKRNSSNLVIIDGEVKVDLCRCGKSKTQPICDGTHRTCGFAAEENEIKIVVEKH